MVVCTMSNMLAAAAMNLRHQYSIWCQPYNHPNKGCRSTFICCAVQGFKQGVVPTEAERPYHQHDLFPAMRDDPYLAAPARDDSPTSLGYSQVSLLSSYDEVTSSGVRIHSRSSIC